MNDPYQKLFESINKAITQLGNMIAWIAKRTLTAKEFTEFVEEFADKTDRQKDLEDILSREDEKR